jgi:hypothetical protein
MLLFVENRRIFVEREGGMRWGWLLHNAAAAMIRITLSGDLRDGIPMIDSLGAAEPP